MADYAKGTLRGKKRELELALEGSFTDNQRWLLGKELRQVEWLEIQIEVLEQEIERRMIPFEEPMQRVQSIPGIDRKTAWMIVAELGVDTIACVPHERVRRCGAFGQLGGFVSGQPGEWRQANERTGA